MTAWSADWSYGYLRRLLVRVKQEYSLEPLAQVPAVLEAGRRAAFIRHDIDVSLERARALAEAEASWGVFATYHVMLSCPFYDVSDAASRAALAAIRACGHEVGLHYHPAHDEATRPPHPVDEEIAAACARLEDAIGTTVESVSFHLPPAGLIGGPLRVAGRVNAYAAPLLKWYLSDSRGRWREGEPLLTLDTPRAEVFQILVHPLWWGETSEMPVVRLAGLMKDLATSTGTPFDELADLAQKHILVTPTLPPPRC